MDGEASGATEALELLRDHQPGLLVADVSLAEGSSGALIAEARSLVPELRIILVAPASRPPPAPAEGLAGPDVVLLRPFRIRQFVDALAPRGPSGPTPVG